jgi:hypothetical protein
MLPLAPFDRSQIITRVTLVAAAICVRRNHILKFFSPYFLINHPAQQSGGTFQIPTALESARGTRCCEHVVCRAPSWCAAVDFPVFNFL